MRWFVPLVFVVVLILGCSGAAPTALPAPTVDVSATVEAAVEATRAVDRSVSATSEARAGATRAAVPTATPVVMTIYAPTPEPYVAAPGSIEQGIEEMYTCLQESDEFRSLFLTGVEQAGLSRESASDFADLFLEDKELFIEAMLQAAEEDPEYASMVSLLGGKAGDLCGPGVVAGGGVPFYDLGMSDADAQALLGELFDCHESDPDVRALLMVGVEGGAEERLAESLMSNRELFITATLVGARLDPDASEMLESLDLLLEAVCR